MRTQNYSKLLIILVISLFGTLSHGSDVAKEKRWAAQISDSLLVGEPVWLEGKSRFLGIYTPSQAAKTQGAAILLHGIGAHPDWPEVINPLRSELPDHGWATLSIQMPILANDAKIADYAPLFDEVPGRIKAAIAYLKKKNIRNVVIIAHSLGTAMASRYLATTPKSPIRAYVAISMVENKPEVMSNLASLKKIRLPLLDIYGSRDQDNVLRTARMRKQIAARIKNNGYTQIKIEGADHFFTGHEAQLVKRIRGWLQRHAAGTEIRK